MKRWVLRHRGYRVGFIGILVSSFFFLIGFASPAWQGNLGLWLTCNSDSRLCISHSSSASSAVFPVWFDAVRSFECLALVFLGLCIATEMYLDFWAQPSPDRRLVELFAIAAGTFGVVGSIVFAAFSPMSGSMFLSWAFALSTTSSCFVIAFASVIAYFRRRGLDVRNYAAENAIHYRSSDEVIMPNDLNGLDLAPPPYSEVVGTAPAVSRINDRVQGTGQLKPVIVGDSIPPPAYYPPPPSSHMEAPPPYSPSSSQLQRLPSTDLPCQSGTAVPRHSETEGQSETHLLDSGPSVAETSLDHASSSGSTEAGGEPGGLPVYYVTVLGQAVPVFREELLQSGMDLLSMQQASLPVPVYFIEMQGQHVPVYSEEQARTLTG